MSKAVKNKGIRIIAGQWRGRRLPVPDLPGLRPTGDRVRETLFNWIQTDIRGARCLDLFAGSGALGLEAASRGAADVLMLEKNPVAVSQLRENCHLLKADNIEILQADALRWLEEPASSAFGIVFIDPPFDSEWQSQVLAGLVENGFLAAAGLVYVESASRLPEPVPPTGLKQIKSRQLGEVRMQLFSA